MRHYWNANDDAQLLREVATVQKTNGNCACGKQAGGERANLWPRCAARMLPIVVSPNACRSRWERLRRDSAENTPAMVVPRVRSQWERLGDEIDQAQDNTQKELCSALDAVKELCNALDAVIAGIRRCMDLRYLGSSREPTQNWPAKVQTEPETFLSSWGPQSATSNGGK